MVTPPGYLIYKVVIRDGPRGKWDAFMVLLKHDHTFTLLLLVYGCSISLWAILKAISWYGRIVFGSDRIFWSIQSILELCAALPFIINCLFLEHVPVMFHSIPRIHASSPLNSKKQPNNQTYDETSPIHSDRNYLGYSARQAVYPPTPLTWDDDFTNHDDI